MGKLKILSGKDVCKLLESNGFQKVRQKGSHIIMQKKIGDSTITVPIPNHSQIKIGTLQSIIRQTKLNREIFEV
ncbi:MAG: type II toxin-antitoxin system HicA family toxin [Ignavibacteriota bacterium]|nr:type II toxin-antitoxin system HicA family toxin [Ignavibacteriales bacterium]MBL1123070.1 type II toxin-antitoxin system HicA family toxin [Ignavibacteriota bacterium]MCC7094271.1 type II toxin-antitoxin system HicA family toxin [Ignavibacteriaceae bacterium]MCE7855717.1 type II toxin-antitoxin system HicA family toxin [Ignavibacteria bacterium CHB3]MEB2295056.1 type II toxin-antitoxin system HicA family toxin [Ignavibacteria bacterium]